MLVHCCQGLFWGHAASLRPGVSESRLAQLRANCRDEWRNLGAINRIHREKGALEKFFQHLSRSAFILYNRDRIRLAS